MEGEAKKNKKKILIVSILVFVIVIALAAAAVLGSGLYLKQKSEKIIDTVSENSATVNFTDGAPAYKDSETGYENYNLFSVKFTDRDNIETRNASLVYNGDTPVYNKFYMDEQPMRWQLQAKLFGGIEMVSCEEGNTARFTVETDENGSVTSLVGTDLPTYVPADQEFTDAFNRYYKYKDRYDNMDAFMEEFLTSAYYGETTWNDVISEVFVPEPSVIVEPYDYKDEDNTVKGYKITISGSYYPNAVSVRELVEEGTMEICVDPNDTSSFYLLSGEDILDAFDVYISLGTQWYMYGF